MSWYPRYAFDKKQSKISEAQEEYVSAYNLRVMADSGYKGKRNQATHKEYTGYLAGAADNQRKPNYWHLGSAIAPDNRPFMQQYHGGKRVGNTQFIVPSDW
eukprot:UN00268